jgi:hypothetical protein
MENKSGKLCVLISKKGDFVNLLDYESHKVIFVENNSLALILEESFLENEEDSITKVLVENKTYLCPGSYIKLI